jgi:hypothetical protein
MLGLRRRDASAWHGTNGWTVAVYRGRGACSSGRQPSLLAEVIVMGGCHLDEWQHAQEDRVFIGKMVFQRSRDMQPDRPDQEL